MQIDKHENPPILTRYIGDAWDAFALNKVDKLEMPLTPVICPTTLSTCIKVQKQPPKS